MNFSPLSRPKSRNSFRRTLLRPALHNFSALKPANLSNGITYGPKCPKTRKSFRRLLLPLFVPVSPLGAHSYKKIGGGPLPLSPKSAEFPERLSPTSNLFSFNHLSRFHSSPPHVSPLESYGCRKQGWVGGMDGFVGATFRWPGSPSRCQTIGRPLPREATRITFGGTQNRRVFFLSWN